jgi:hypothetical protein
MRAGRLAQICGSLPAGSPAARLDRDRFADRQGLQGKAFLKSGIFIFTRRLPRSLCGV